MQSTFLPLASTILQVENRRRYLIEDFHADSAILIPLLLMPRDKVRPWTWNASRELAAQLVADKQLTNFEIARRAGVSDSQLNRWKLAPEFASRVTEHVATFRASITTTGLARRENRIAAKKARAAALRRVIRQRAEAYGHGEPQYNPVTGVPLLDKKTNAPIVVPIPGGDTGMVVRQPRTAGVQFSVDGVLLAELSALEEQIAIEMGDGKRKSPIEVVGGPSMVDILRDRRLRRAHLVEQDVAEELCLRLRRIEQAVTWSTAAVCCERTRLQLRSFLHWCRCPKRSMAPGRRLNIGEAFGALP
jgi:hypothetical protein